MRPLKVDEGYRRWAPSYSDETAISFLEDGVVSAMTPPLSGARLLDAGCGTGRRVRNSAAAFAVGLESSRAMLAAGIAKDGPMSGIELVVGDVRDMPLDDRSFDVVWCRLVLGHLASIEQAYAELARVAVCGAIVIVSDFHPAAAGAGHRRSFRIGDEQFELEHHVHQPEDHIAAARAVGLGLREIRDVAIGADVRSFYEKAGKLEVYPDHFGLAVVLALAFRKER